MLENEKNTVKIGELTDTESDDNDRTPVEDVLTWELRHYKEEILSKDLKNTLGKTENLMTELQRHFFPRFEDQIIYFDIHEDKHQYVDEEEIWVETKYTLEIHLDSISPLFLMELERVFGNAWTIQSARGAGMVMKFDLTNGNVTKCDE